MPCGECEPCVNTPGLFNLCENMGCYGLMGEQVDNKFNGWFGDYLVLKPGSTFFRVSEFSLKERILIEPIAVHAIERAKTTGLIDLSTPVLIQGSGPIGLSVISVLKTMGVQNIIAVNGEELRLELAKQLGAKQVVNYKNYTDSDALIEVAKDITGGRGAGFAFQCTGVPSSAATVFKLIARGSDLCEVSFFVDNDQASFNPHFDICNKELTLVGRRHTVLKTTQMPFSA